MAKDRRGSAPRKEVTKSAFIARLAVAVLMMLLGIVLVVMMLIMSVSDHQEENSSLPFTTVDSSTTVTTAATSSTVTTFATTTDTSTTATTSTTETSTTTETTTEVTTTETTTETTTTTAATTTTTAASSTSSNVPWNLRLVNKWTPMTQAESETLPIQAFRDGESVDARIIDPLNAMLSDASQYGLWVTSSYRAYSTQEQLYKNKVQRVINERGCSYEEALVIAATEVAAPGTSEHNTGLAVDLLYTGMWSLEQDWENGEVFDWLMAHCHEYGFILRFPKGKEAITGVIYEPWHYRYVGVEAATYIMQNGLTLEEYVQQQGLY